MSEAAREFLGTQRFRICRTLGAGGMGVVYEAVDQLTNKTVALKTLGHADPEHIYRLKREFRELADVSHPNLASLYELMSEGRHWFFTMELVDGVTFTRHVRPEIEGGCARRFRDGEKHARANVLRRNQTDFARRASLARALLRTRVGWPT